MSNDAHSITLAQLGEFVAQLGIDWTPDTIREITMEPGKVTVVRNRVNEQGIETVLLDHDELATETVTIAVVK